MCISWDTGREVPCSVEIHLQDFSIWQPVIFKNIPYHCFRCNKKGHLARDCRLHETMLETASPPCPVDIPVGVEVSCEPSMIAAGISPLTAAMSRNMAHGICQPAVILASELINSLTTRQPDETFDHSAVVVSTQAAVDEDGLMPVGTVRENAISNVLQGSNTVETFGLALTTIISDSLQDVNAAPLLPTLAGKDSMVVTILPSVGPRADVALVEAYIAAEKVAISKDRVLMEGEDDDENDVVTRCSIRCRDV